MLQCLVTGWMVSLSQPLRPPSLVSAVCNRIAVLHSCKFPKHNTVMMWRVLFVVSTHITSDKLLQTWGLWSWHWCYTLRAANFCLLLLDYQVSQTLFLWFFFLCFKIPARHVFVMFKNAVPLIKIWCWSLFSKKKKKKRIKITSVHSPSLKNPEPMNVQERFHFKRQEMPPASLYCHYHRAFGS